MNRRAKIKELTTLACHIAHTRDSACALQSRECQGKLEAHHAIPRSRGWIYATDDANITLLCTYHHSWLHAGVYSCADLIARMHEKYADYTPHPVTAAELEGREHDLRYMLARYKE